MKYTCISCIVVFVYSIRVSCVCTYYCCCCWCYYYFCLYFGLCSSLYFGCFLYFSTILSSSMLAIASVSGKRVAILSTEYGHGHIEYHIINTPHGMCVGVSHAAFYCMQFRIRKLLLYFSFSDFTLRNRLPQAVKPNPNWTDQTTQHSHTHAALTNMDVYIASLL